MQYKHLDDVPSTLYNSHASFVLLYRSHKVSSGDREPLEVVGGMNLPMLVNAVLAREGMF